MQERLQKIIAAAGLTSRRKAEELIVQGHVSVNGRVVTELGSKADPERDHIKVNGKLLRGAPSHGPAETFVGQQGIPELVLVALEHPPGGASAEESSDFPRVLSRPAQGDKRVALVDDGNILHAFFRGGAAAAPREWTGWLIGSNRTGETPSV